jgi:hypothetical protein
MSEAEYWSKCFITQHTTEYCLLDDSGDIRATAFNLESIYTARRYYGWGTIHKCKMKKLVEGKKESIILLIDKKVVK